MGVYVCLQVSTRAATKALEGLNKEVTKKQRWVHQTHVLPLDAMIVAMFEVMVFVPGWLKNQGGALLPNFAGRRKGRITACSIASLGTPSPSTFGAQRV